jgi:hypothetical protein
VVRLQVSPTFEVLKVRLCRFLNSFAIESRSR